MSSARNRSGWKPLLRLARRDVRRHPWRTVLIAAAIALPVMAVTFTNMALYIEDTRNDAHASEVTFGQAAALIDSYYFGAELIPTSELPSGSVTLQRRYTVVRTQTDIPLQEGIFVDGLLGDLGHPLLQGRYVVVDGRIPDSSLEAAVSERLAREAGLRRGSTVWLADATAPSTIVGTYRDRNDRNDVSIATTADAALTGAVIQLTTFLPDSSTTQASYGPDSVMPRLRGQEPGSVPPEVRFAIQMGTAVVLMALGLVITSAFATGARRQLREVGLAGANGADPRHVRYVFALQGTITAIAGLLAGFAGVIVGVLLFGDRVRRAIGRDVPFGILPIDLLISVSMVIAAGTFAAWWPARSVARTPILAALAGRRPTRAASPILSVVAVALLGGGLVVFAVGMAGDSAWLILGGCALIIVGLANAASWLTSVVGRWLAHLPGAARVVGRSAARQRSRTGPLVGAIASATTLAIVGLVAQSSEIGARDASLAHHLYVSVSPAMHQPEAIEETLMMVDQVTSARPAFVIEASAELATPNGGSWVTIVDQELLDEGPARAALTAGNVVTLSEAAPPTIDLEARMYTNEGLSNARSLADVEVQTIEDAPELAAVTADGCYPQPCEPLSYGYAIGTVTAEALGIDLVRASRNAVVSTDDATVRLTDLAAASAFADSFEKARRLELATGGTETKPGLRLFIDEGDAAIYRTVFRIMIALLSVLVMSTLGIGLVLSRLEQRDDEALLQALGAAPGFRRRTGAIEAALLCGLGVGLAVPVGLIAARLIREAISTEPVVVPWWWIGAIVIGLPSLSALFFGAFRRSPRRLTLAD
jgi:putative ABC transport system permease protein